MTKRPISPGAEELLGLYFPVLDHGFVALVDYMGTDECIERAARVSYGYGTRQTNLTRGLIRYLRRHLHTTPSEMVEFKFHCCMPMFVARQWIRHRSACLAGDAQLWFDLPGAARRGKRQRRSVPLSKFHRMWHEGTQHLMSKKKPLHLDRVQIGKSYTIPELARLVERREETLRNCVRDGSLRATRVPQRDPRRPSIFVSGSAWHEFATTRHMAHVTMRDRLKRVQLRSVDEESGEIISTRVLDVWESGRKPVFRIRLTNGNALSMSKDHRCLTAKGWLTLEQATNLRLSPTGGVSWDAAAPAFAVNGRPAYQDPEWLRSRRGEGLSLQEIADLAGTSYHNLRRYLKQFGLSYSQKERSRLSGIARRGRKRRSSTPRLVTERFRAAVALARSGPRSNFWKGGVSTEREGIGRWTTQIAAAVHRRFEYRCVICGSKSELHAHHIDPVWHNPRRARDFENLISLCRACHDTVHADNSELAFLDLITSGASLHTFFEKRARQPRPRQKLPRQTTRLRRTFANIVSIEYVGEQMTYDLAVSGPFHNFVASGLVVHNSVNEYSGRYSLMPMLFYTPNAEQLQTQSRTNSQGRSGESVPEEVFRETLRRWEVIRSESSSTYEWLTEQQVARELARIDLPLSSYTQWYWKIDLHNLLHFLRLRVDSHAQWEIQEYGRVMAGMLKRAAPLSYEAWIDFDVCGARLSRGELEALRRLIEQKGDGLAAKAGGSLSARDLEALGLAKREVRELLEKLADARIPDFDLDLATAHPAEFFASRFAEAVPKVDKPPDM